MNSVTDHYAYSYPRKLQHTVLGPLTNLPNSCGQVVEMIKYTEIQRLT